MSERHLPIQMQEDRVCDVRKTIIVLSLYSRLKVARFFWRMFQWNVLPLFSPDFSLLLVWHECGYEINWQREYDGRVLFSTYATQCLQISKLKKVTNFMQCWKNQFLNFLMEFSKILFWKSMTGIGLVSNPFWKILILGLLPNLRSSFNKVTSNLEFKFQF